MFNGLQIQLPKKVSEFIRVHIPPPPFSHTKFPEERNISIGQVQAKYILAKQYHAEIPNITEHYL
jgi:hypothetical protein